MDADEIAPEFEMVCPAPDADSFTIGGVTYTRSNGLFIGRQKVFQRFQIEFGQGLSMKAFADNTTEIKNALNKTDFVAAAHAVESQVQGIAMIGANRIRELEILGLFFNRVGPEPEDPTTYDHAAFTKKIYSDWAGLHAGFVFLAALRCMQIGYGSMYPLQAVEAPAPGEAPSSTLPS